MTEAARGSGRPQADDGFEWGAAPWGPVLRCPALGAVGAHLFTARDLALEHPETSGDGWARVAGALGVAPEALRRVRQVHGAAAVCYRKGGVYPGALPAADIVLTDDPSLAVAVQVADCVPLLLADTGTGAVCAAHVGWRGAAAGVPGAAVVALADAFGSRSADLVAAIGPSIGPCCYEVGEEVRAAFREAARGGRPGDAWFLPGARGRPYLDLWRATADQLLAAGLDARRIHTSRLCTADHRRFFHSYRADGPGTGRMAAAIRMLNDGRLTADG